MKKLLVLILASFMLLSLGACTSEDRAQGDDSGSNPAPANTGANNPAPANNPDPAPASDFDSGRRIAVFTREDGSGTRDAFASITGVGDDMFVEAVVLTAGGELRSGVAGNEYGIGYVSVGSLNETVKALAIGGVMPSAATIIDGSYPIQRPFLIVTNDDKDADPLVQDFIRFALSAQGQECLGTSWTSAGSTGDYTPAGLSGTLKIGGSTSVAPLMQLMRTAYIELNPNVSIEISEGGSGTGISEATSGVIDIGMSSRNLRDTEADALNEYAIALDGVAVIVNTANPVSSMNMETVKDIFTGDKTVWNQVG
ncbi:MAG: substrate-binding domain-containing protein [Oscillospiraceae bacterium]|nr:substrate-binding domain-containing protein [Oscillospiraceae bacterium]